ncbi:hypothetical protein EV06_1269 [Prochlorococcus sp. MIT 0602]|nr:hypothetical protein EV06_1269 [Prochlorococcus sp. MIT 0602]
MILGGYTIYSSTDKYLTKYIETSRPDFEKKLSKQLGHPALIGPYQGLRPWGFAVGRSKLLEGSQDASTATFQGLKIQFAPFASFLKWKPVLILSPKEARINLKANENGKYWILGQQKDGSPPKLNLRIRLDDSSSLILDSSKDEIKASARASFDLSSKKVSGYFALFFVDNGSLSIRGNTRWDVLDFKGRAKVNNLNLDNFQSIFFSGSDLITKGKVNANLKLGMKDSDIHCQGGILLENLNVTRRSPEPQTLFSKTTSINCRNNVVIIPKTALNYGRWKVDVSANMPIKNKSLYNMTLFSSLRPRDATNSVLDVNASLPLLFDDQLLSLGELNAELSLKALPLSSLESIIGTNLAGTLSSNGTISGPLSSLTTNLFVQLNNPQFGPVRLQEKWQGDFIGLPTGGGTLKMSSVEGAVPGILEAKLNKNWSLQSFDLNRLSGKFSLMQTNEGYGWDLDDFRLDRIELSLPPEKSFKRTFGELAGKGTIKTSPLIVDGSILYRFPRLLGVNLKEVTINGSYSMNKYSISGQIVPSDTGEILFNANGSIGGFFKLKAIAKGITPQWLADSSLKISQFNLKPRLARGSADDLTGLSLLSPKESLDDQMSNWDFSRVFVEKYKRNNVTKRIITPSDLSGSIDGEAHLEGSGMSDLKLDIMASGKVWTRGNNINPVAIKPFTATFKSLSLKENGEFSFLNLPISILSLFFSSPSSVTGMFGVTGKYNFKNNFPELDTELVLKDARILEKEITLKKGEIYITKSYLKTNISFKERKSTNPILISGQVPLSSNAPFDLNIQSHGDGLSFLDGLSNKAFSWDAGDADLKLLIKGTLKKPIANGYLDIKNASFTVNDMKLRNFETKILFDFDEAYVHNLQANIGEEGIINSNGRISLFRDSLNDEKSLYVEASNIEISQDSTTFNISSKLNLTGSVVKPLLGGETIINQGSISARRSNPRQNKAINNSRQGVPSNQNRFPPRTFPEQSWDYKRPLPLFIQDQNSSASKILKSGLPRQLSFIGFDSLRLRLGPDLRIAYQPIASFNASGTLVLDGPLNESLDLRGLVRLTKGRVNLFTTTFDLDKSEPNIALFAPSMGLIPYLDITLSTKVPDVIQDPSQLETTNDFAKNGSGSIGIGGSRFVKIKLIATGPADRVSESFQLRSTPALPRNQLLDLIGGNSLTMLMTGSEREVLVDLLNRSFLTPALGNLSDAFSDRIQLSLYPAFVAGKENFDTEGDVVEDNELTNSDSEQENLSPQQAWIAEIGLDLSEKINFSIQTTPNRKDIPPQGTITYQFNPSVGVSGAIDNNGNWQSQLQLFLRY